jgi:AcrR family transcriptional regulator
MARPALTTAQRTEQDRRHHRQLLQGMARCVGAKGFGATTIADVVREARVSKSTFYAHFADKEACYVALYSAAVDNVLDAMREADAAARRGGLGWREHLSAVNAAYLTSLASGGALTRSLLVEFQTAGAAAQAMRRDVFDRYVRFMRKVCDGLRRGEPGLNRISPLVALGVVGGVNEVVMHRIETRGVEAITGLSDVATGLWAAALTGATAPAPATARRR